VSGKIKYLSVRCYVQKDGESWRAVASVEREVVGDAPAPSPVTEFGEVKSDALEAIADALERAGAGGS
jgi:hypothetical protein